MFDGNIADLLGAVARTTRAIRKEFIVRETVASVFLWVCLMVEAKGLAKHNVIVDFVDSRRL